MTMTPIDVEAVLDRMAPALGAFLAAHGRSNPLLIGVRTGGVWVAAGLHRRLGLEEPIGELNISFYRDDFSRKGPHPTVSPSKLPLEVDGRHLVLVDDIIHTGRTVRAAMNEIFDFGRPASITLVALVDRGGRELPVAPDILGEAVSLEAAEHVKLAGPDALRLELHHSAP